MDLVWKPVPNFPAYEVSNRGDIRRGGRVLKVQEHRGYSRVQVWKDAKPFSLRVHRAVCEAFNGPCPAEGMEVEHLDHDKRNNTPANLRWASHAENIRRGVRDGIHPRGENVGQAVLTEDQVRVIKNTPRYYGCCDDLAAEFGVAKQTIGHIRSGLTWRHVK